MSVYETKTVRVHEPDRGQYMYFMLTRFNGEDHILGEIGYRSEYIDIATMTMANSGRVHDTNAYKLAEKHPSDLHCTIWFEFAYNIEHGDLFDDLEDGDRLSRDDVEELIGEEVTA